MPFPEVMMEGAHRILEMKAAEEKREKKNDTGKERKKRYIVSEKSRMGA